ncbi:MAG: hypothetical protein ACTHL8_04420 [Burkholderiaceae bacterium]
MIALFARGEAGLFSSRSITGHLLRGAAAAALLAAALRHQAGHPAAAAAAGLLALVALRGCPVCWSIGLVETVSQRLAARRARRRQP